MDGSFRTKSVVTAIVILVLSAIQWASSRPAELKRGIYLRTVPSDATVFMTQAGSISGTRSKPIGRSPGPLQISPSERSRYILRLEMPGYRSQTVDLTREALVSNETVVEMTPTMPFVPLLYWVRSHPFALAAMLVGAWYLIAVARPALVEQKAQKVLWKDGRLKPGLKFHGYVLGRVLGQGGAGVTYLAWRDGVPDQLYALKALSDSKARDKLFQELKREWKACSSLNHPSILRLVDWGEVSGNVYVVSEFIEGATLEKADRPDPSLVCEWGLQLVDALRYAHEKGVVHRDIKPANLLVAAHDRVKLLDFGIAAGLGEEVEGTEGTPGFMPPEQANGKVAAANDYYSLGVTLYTLLSGAPPFSGDTLYTLLNLQQKKSFRPLRDCRPDLGVEFTALLDGLLEPEPEQRLSDPDQVERLLKACKASLTS